MARSGPWLRSQKTKRQSQRVSASLEPPGFKIVNERTTTLPRQSFKLFSFCVLEGEDRVSRRAVVGLNDADIESGHPGAEAPCFFSDVGVSADDGDDLAL